MRHHSHSSTAPVDQSAGDEMRVRQMLKGYGLRSTSQRLAIMDILATAGSASPGAAGHTGTEWPHNHLTATEIYDALRDAGHHIDVTTIYRTLMTLVNLGVVHTITYQSNVTTYGLAVSAHHHAVCTRCGAVAEIPAEQLAATLAAVSERAGFRERDITLTIHGLCRDCQ